MANRRTGWPAGMAMLANVSHLLIAVNSAINIIVYAIKVLLQEQFKLKEMTMAMIVLHGNYKLISYFLFFLECFYSTAWNRYYSIVLSRVSRHSICNEHTHPNGLTGQTLG